MKKRYILFGFGIIVILLAAYAYYEYNRKAPDLINKEAVENTTASLILSDYTNNEDSANKKYLGKIIQVKGTITEIQNQQDTSITILLGDTLQTGNVSCLMDSKHLESVRKLTLGNVVNVKGICTGFLMDVELNRCVIVK